MRSLFLNTYDLFSRIFEDFNEMEKKIIVINNKNKRKRKRKFRIYHFLVESKPHEGIDLLITASVNIYQTKKRKKRYSNSNENKETSSF